MPLSLLPRKIREGKEEGESDEVTGERRREEMKGSRGSEKSAEGGLGRWREKADGEDGGAAEGASGWACRWVLERSVNFHILMLGIFTELCLSWQSPLLWPHSVNSHRVQQTPTPPSQKPVAFLQETCAAGRHIQEEGRNEETATVFFRNEVLACSFF